jgi:hypothetical protein
VFLSEISFKDILEKYWFNCWFVPIHCFLQRCIVENGYEIIIQWHFNGRLFRQRNTHFERSRSNNAGGFHPWCRCLFTANITYTGIYSSSEYWWQTFYKDFWCLETEIGTRHELSCLLRQPYKRHVLMLPASKLCLSKRQLMDWAERRYHRHRISYLQHIYEACKNREKFSRSPP